MVFQMRHVLFTTDRLSFRVPTISDIDLLYKLDGDPVVRAFFANEKSPDGTLSLAQVHDKITGAIIHFETYGFCELIIESRDTHEFIGRFGSGFDDGEISVGYLLLQLYWGKGFASEALQGYLNWAFNKFPKKYFPKNRIIAIVSETHTASKRVLEKCGMSVYKKDFFCGIPCLFYEAKMETWLH